MELPFPYIFGNIMSSISVIVLTYNNCASLIECVNSILPQLNNGDELLVIDDGSNDGTFDYGLEMTERLRNFKYFNTNLSKDVDGRAASRNIAAYYSEHDILLYIEDIDILHYKCIEYHKTLHTSYHLAMGNRYDGKLEREILAYSFNSNKPYKLSYIEESELEAEAFLTEIGHLLFREFINTGQIKLINQNNFSIKKHLIRQIGGWDENIEDFYEEFNLKLLNQTAFYPCGFNPYCISYKSKRKNEFKIKTFENLENKDIIKERCSITKLF